jgi:SAM-dependent methyltransferase
MAKRSDENVLSGNREGVELGGAQNAFELFLISVVILFLELACIRWFPANVLYLTFFTNTVLLACFLGMSLGCLAAGHRRNYLNFTPLVLGLATLTALGVGLLRDHMEKMVKVGNQESPQQIYFGTEYGNSNPDQFVIPIEFVEGAFFLLIALAMLGPGQQLGRALARMPNRLAAYTTNILGSIAGIGLFSLCAWLQLSPGRWFLIVSVGLGYFLVRPPFGVWQIVRGVLLAAIVVLASSTKLILSAENEEFWSPYYRIDYTPSDYCIDVNLIGHQQMIPRDAKYPAYAIPYLLNRDAGGKPFKNVMIIGAGSGNDLSRSLQWGAEHIDAVEIDPVIRELGRKYHPDQPYSDTDRVIPRQADGRNFLRSTDEKYDLVIYALVDSLVLHSSYSNIRLESYLFTKEAFADVKRCLGPDGVFVMYNFFRHGWLIARLQNTLTEVFGTKPLVIMLPYKTTVEPDLNWNGFTVFIAGSAEALEPLRKAFASLDARGPVYWIDPRRFNDPGGPNGFRDHPELADVRNWLPIGLADVEQPADGIAVATDDWPFLYLRQPMIPDLSLRGATIMAALAMLMMVWFVPPRTQSTVPWGQELHQVISYWAKGSQSATQKRRFDGRMFFLGAGFMLIETKSVVHMALVFGSTWMVNSVVFLAVLVMILLANLFVAKFRPQQLWFYYAGLFATLLLNVVVPLNFFLGWPIALQMGAASLLVFVPVWFAGIIFAVLFNQTTEPDRAFGFNIAGAMLGGLAEYSSMLLGFRHLLLVAVVFYAMSALWRSKLPREALAQS